MVHMLEKTDHTIYQINLNQPIAIVMGSGGKIDLDKLPIEFSFL